MTASVTDWNGEPTALELRADVTSLEGLHVQRRQLLPEYATLRALHGPFGKWDARRKAMLSVTKVKVRGSVCPHGKWTDASVDDTAHADEHYISVVDQGVMAAIRYTMLDMEMTEIEERIRSREIELRAYTVEAGIR